MGKKSKYKKIRQIAANMPPLARTVMVGSLVRGSEVEAEEVDGQPVDPNGTYRQKTPTTVQHNHYRKMKDIYQKHGAMGVQRYYDEVNQFVAMREAERQMKEEKAKAND